MFSVSYFSSSDRLCYFEILHTFSDSTAVPQRAPSIPHSEFYLRPAINLMLLLILHGDSYLVDPFA